jgi:glycine cleavage system T protein (aminomethyltransferase)
MGSGAPALLRTPLHDVHRRLGARMVDFAGWDMPVQYPSGIIAEHRAVRSACGIFDLSHTGRVYVRGPDALRLAQLCCTRDLSRIRAGEAAYSLLCNEQGGILDDVIAYVLDAETVLFVFNASNRESDVAWLSQKCDQRGFEAEVDDQTLATALIGVQGPTAQSVLQPICNNDLGALPGYAFLAAVEVAGRPALVARTGYTGEDGFEVLTSAQDAEHVWHALLSAQHVTACGLGARDTLRTEAGMALYGHEIDQHTNPYEARLGWVCSLHKPEFIGRETLAAMKVGGPTRLLVGLLVEPGAVPRPGFPIVHANQSVGSLTSGTFSPTLKRNIGMGYAPRALSEPGQTLHIEMRGKLVGAEVIKLPFVPHRTRPRAKITPEERPHT